MRNFANLYSNTFLPQTHLLYYAKICVTVTHKFMIKFVFYSILVTRFFVKIDLNQ